MTALAGRSTLPLADSPLGRTIAATDTDIWNDSCAVDELEYALSFGAVGATANPTIVVDVWNTEPGYWRGRLQSLAAELPRATVSDLAWAVVQDMSLRGARLLEPVFEAHAGRQGRLSAQTNPMFFRSPERMVDQAVHFSGLAPNIIVKLPATSAGIEGIEEATYRGVSVNVTVSFTVAQALAAAEAIERGLSRRTPRACPPSKWGGRHADDGPDRRLVRVVVDRDGLTVSPDALPWTGVAVFKRAYGLFRERRYRARLLGAAIRHHYHWSDLIGGDVIITLPAAWQRRFNASDIEVRPRMDDPVDPRSSTTSRGTSRTSSALTSPTGLRFPSSMPSGRRPAHSGAHRFVPGAADQGHRRPDPEPRPDAMTGARETRADERALHRRAGSTAADGWSLIVTPESAGWGHAGLRIVALEAHGSIDFATGPDEAVVLPLAGAVRVTCDGEGLHLAGRSGPFTGSTDFAYVPPDTAVTLEVGVAAGSLCAPPAQSDGSHSGMGPRRACPSTPGAGASSHRCATSPLRTRSPRTGSSPSR